MNIHAIHTPNLGGAREYTERILKFLRARSLVAGLEINDAALRFTYWTGREWQMISLRLPPGIILGGHVENPALFAQALLALRKQIKVRGDQKRVNVIVCLSSVDVYTQVFSLPELSVDSLERAVDLNIRMISPSDLSQMYAGWQLLSRASKNVRAWEVLSGFIPRAVVDPIVTALAGTGFLPVAVESKAVALARLVRSLTVGFDAEKPALVLLLDGNGLDFLVLRSGQLYFEYATPWADVPGADKGVTKEMLQSVITRNLAQVRNFFEQQWPSESVTDIWLSASALEAELEQILAANFKDLTVRIIRLRGTQEIPADWHIALGSGLRGQMPRRDDREMSLMGIGARAEFAEEELLSFLAFWRVLVPVALGLLLVLFVLVESYLKTVNTSLQAQIANQPGNSRLKEIDTLEKRAEEFNRAVAMVQKIEQGTDLKEPILRALDDVITRSGVKIVRMGFQNKESPITLAAEASSEDQIRGLKNLLDTSDTFAETRLPYAEIKPGPQGLSFTVSFMYRPKNKPPAAPAGS